MISYIVGVMLGGGGGGLIIGESWLYYVYKVIIDEKEITGWIISEKYEEWPHDRAYGLIRIFSHWYDFIDAVKT